VSELEWLDIFANNLIEILAEARMSQRELADKAGLSESAVSSYIHKVKMPGIKAVVNMAYALHCGVEELIDFGDVII
jgi:transcriptional regulator with XRE-family HTH domain